MDQSLPNPHQGRAPQRAAASVGAFRQGNVPTLERGVISGDKVQFSRPQRHTRLSHSEVQSSGEEWLNRSMEGSGSYGESPVYQGMQAEGIRHHRSSYEQAGNNYPRRISSNGNGPLSSSPRSPNTRGYMTFQSSRNRGQQQEGRPVTVKASGTPHRQYSRGRNRTSSETEQGGKGSRGPHQRKRGLSETEIRPKWDKYGNLTGNGRDLTTKMSGLQCLASENIWFDKHRYDEAEKCFYEGANGPSTQQQQDREVSTILQDMALSRKNILQSISGVKTTLQQAKGRQPKRQHRNSSSHGGDQELVTRMKSMELENQALHKVVESMRAALQKLESRVAMLEKTPAAAAVPSAKAAPVKQVNGNDADDDDDDDDDMDLFGSDDDDAEAERLKQERIDAYTAKKAKKPTLIAKSSILLDVKPWDDETDMAKLEECVRTVQMDGLLWGASKLVPVGYGIKKLQINCVVEDDKVGTDILEEEITKFEDFVQSVDVAAFNKI